MGWYVDATLEMRGAGVPSSIAYPSSLPSPSAAAVTPAERRLLSDVTGGPQDARTLQRDYLGTQKVRWLFTDSEALTFEQWWMTTLVAGGAGFAAAWPTQFGPAAATRRFVGSPAWTYVPTFDQGVSDPPPSAPAPAPIPSGPGVQSVGWALNPAPAPGWYSTATGSEFGPFAHTNAGSITFNTDMSVLWCGVVNWNITLPVTWHTVWAPLDGGVQPQIDTHVSPPRLAVTLPRSDFLYGAQPFKGLLTVSATVGNVQSDSIQMAVTGSGYASIAWGPA